jgi:hypothetical protein
VSDKQRVLDQARQALSDPSAHKQLCIATMVERTDPTFVFDARVPRNPVNDLGGTVSWTTESREEAVAFLRELIMLISKGASS